MDDRKLTVYNGRGAANRGSLSSQKTEQEQIQQNNVYDTMIFSENLFPLESDCGIMKLSTNRDREVNLYE